MIHNSDSANYDDLLKNLILILLTVFYYYDPASKCEKGSATIPAPIENLKCNVKCPEGQFLATNITKKASKCDICPANTYSVNGILIDGQMGDWVDIEEEQEKDSASLSIPI
jgi:hypothetical protein